MKNDEKSQSDYAGENISRAHTHSQYKPQKGTWWSLHNLKKAGYTLTLLLPCVLALKKIVSRFSWQNLTWEQRGLIISGFIIVVMVIVIAVMIILFIYMMRRNQRVTDRLRRGYVQRQL